MSIADDEAEQAYPARYWNGTHVKEQFYCGTDDLQEAYLRGRTAPPTSTVSRHNSLFATASTSASAGGAVRPRRYASCKSSEIGRAHV